MKAPSTIEAWKIWNRLVNEKHPAIHKGTCSYCGDTERFITQANEIGDESCGSCLLLNEHGRHLVDILERRYSGNTK